MSKKSKKKQNQKETETNNLVINQDVPQADTVNFHLSDIAPPPHNPRKIFQAEDMRDLTQSIAANGLLQPIALRKINGKYELIYGERRYRASIEVFKADKNKDTIAARIYENLSDQQVLEMQIIENMQRKDIHPLEEAEAFAKLIKDTQASVQEIALKVGKSASYVAHRIKLNELSEEFKQALYNNLMNLQTAFLLCKLSLSVQENIWEENFKEDFNNGELEEIEFNQRQIDHYLLDLTKAPFDTTDVKLCDKGACINCPFNTATNSLLFPELAEQATCTNAVCYNEKAIASFEIQLKEATENPAVVLINTEYGEFDEQTEILIEKGYEVLARNEYRKMEMPEAPKLEEFKEDLENEVYEDEQEMQQRFDDAEQEYTVELSIYNEYKEGGRIIQGFIVQGNDMGTLTDIVLVDRNAKQDTQTGSAKEYQEKLKSEGLSPDDVDKEITRITSNEIRKKELDEEKVQPLFYETLKGNTAFLHNSADLLRIENAALYMLLVQAGGHELSKEFLAEALQDEHELSYEGFMELGHEKQQEIINKLARIVLLLNFKPYKGQRPTKCDKALCIKELAYYYCPEDAEQIWNTQMEVRNKREYKLKERTEELDKKKAGLLRVKQLEQKAA